MRCGPCEICNGRGYIYAKPSRSFSIASTHQTELAEAPKMRGRRRSVEAETAILKATLYLLERKPLRKVTADAIARRAGVSKATIYKLSLIHI